MKFGAFRESKPGIHSENQNHYEIENTNAY